MPIFRVRVTEILTHVIDVQAPSSELAAKQALGESLGIPDRREVKAETLTQVGEPRIDPRIRA